MPAAWLSGHQVVLVRHLTRKWDPLPICLLIWQWQRSLIRFLWHTTHKLIQPPPCHLLSKSIAYNYDQLLYNIELHILLFKSQFLCVILWPGDGLYTSPPWLLNRSQQNLARTFCQVQSRTSWKRNIKILIGCHGNLEMRILMPHLALKDQYFAAKPNEKLIGIGPQIFWLSWNSSFSVSFHGNSKKLVTSCTNLKAMIYRMKKRQH